MIEKKRMTAIKVTTYDLVNGKYFPAQGFTPGFVITPKGMKVSRARVMGTVVKKFSTDDKMFVSVTIDDGLATIRAKSFNAPTFFKDVEEGDIVDIIGKVKLYNGEIYLNTEVVWKAQSPKFEILRRLEIKKQEKEWDSIKKKIYELKDQTADLEELKTIVKNTMNIDPDTVENIFESEESSDVVESEKRIFDIIRNSTNGKTYEELVNETNYSEELIDKIVDKLLSDGVCFEPKPGLIRAL